MRSVLAATLPPVAIFAVQSFFWSTLSPFAWFLFFPAVLVSSWIGGLWSGVGASVLSTALVWWAFLPPEGSFRLEDPKYIVQSLAFLAMGVALGAFSGRLKRANREAADALAASERAVGDLRQAVHERRVFAALVENSSDFIGIADKDGKPMYLNPAGRRMVGLSADYPVETTQILDYYPPDQRPFASGVILKSMVESGQWRGETAFRSWQTNEAIPVSDTHFMIREPDTGHVLGMGTITRDITDRKRTESEQRFLSQVASVLASTIDHEETLASVANLVIRELAECCIINLMEEDGHLRRVVVVHRDPAMTDVAHALQRIEIDPGRPHLGSSVLETKQPLVMSEVTSEYLTSIAQNEEHALALRGLAPTSLLGVPLLAHGRLLGALLFVQTGAGRPYRVQDLGLAQELANRAALAVHNARLYWAARSATEARDELLGIVAHDLRNPLNAIMLQAALLQRGRPEGPEEGQRRSRQPAETIRRAAFRMNRLIEDLLEVTRIEAGQFSVERGLVAPEHVVRDVAEAQAALVSGGGLELRLDLVGDLPSISGDRQRLLQVFENLIGNAVKFTPPGGRITVGATRRDREITFWVENTGRSIPQEHLPHLFDRFWQARRGEHSGAGLGLSIVKGIVQAHGGRVWVESTPGGATTFYFTVPVPSAAEEPKPAVLH